MKFFKTRVNQQPRIAGGDIYRSMCRQNRMLFTLLLIVFLGGLSLSIAYIIKPMPVLLVDEQGRYVAKVNYLSATPLSPLQLESMVKRFVQYYLSQNSATIYEDAVISLAALCPSLRTETQRQWIEGGKLARIVQRLQLSRVIFTNVDILKYIDIDDVQVRIQGKVLIAGLQDSDDMDENNFDLELSLKLVPLSIQNYLGIEVCSVRFV